MFPKIYYHFIEGQTFFKIPDVKLPQENSDTVVENAVKASNRTLLVWVPGCFTLGQQMPAMSGRWTTGSLGRVCRCLWVTKLQSNTVLKVFLQKVIKCSFLAFMALFSFKELHFPVKELELKYTVDTSISVSQRVLH